MTDIVKVVEFVIHLFNRKELLTTYDLREVNRIREILLANRIECRVKVVNAPMGAGRNCVSFSRRQEQYVIYVHKTEAEYAMYLLRNS